MGSTASEVDICNMALGEVSDDTITALSDASEAGRRCTLLYPQARDEALELHEWRFATARDTLVRDGASVDISDETGVPASVTFRPNGKKMYVLGGTSVYQYTLTTAWEITTASYASKTFDFSTEEATPTGIAFSADGTKMFMVGTTDDIVEQYTLSTPWDVSTATADAVQLDVSSEDTAPEGITFGNGGLKLYVVGNTNNSIFEYTLTTAYDLSTASYASKTISVASEDTNPVSVAFSSAGTAMFVAGSETDAVYQYTLSTAWDCSTATYDSVDFQLVDDDNVITGITFNTDGTRLYIVGSENDEVFQYGMVAWALSTASDSKPVSGFAYRYSAPSDMIRAIRISHSGDQVEPNWMEEDGFIHTDETSVELVYIKRVTTTARFSPLFVYVVSLTLGAKIAAAIKGDRNLQNQLIVRRNEAIMQSALKDARSGNPEKQTANEGWTDRDNIDG
jgi:sugar lactone lactonase YvrE